MKILNCFVNEFENSVLLGVLPSCQKAHSPFSIVSIFVRSISEKKRNSRTFYSSLERA